MPPGSASVLASMTAHVPGPVEVGREYVISAWKVSSEGRKHRGASALFDADGAARGLRRGALDHVANRVSRLAAVVGSENLHFCRNCV